MKKRLVGARPKDSSVVVVVVEGRDNGLPSVLRPASRRRSIYYSVISEMGAGAAAAALRGLKRRQNKTEK